MSVTISHATSQPCPPARASSNSGRGRDHTPFHGSAKNTTLYMTEAEQHAALAEAGFTDVRVELRISSLVLYAGMREAAPSEV